MPGPLRLTEGEVRLPAAPGPDVVPLPLEGASIVLRPDSPSPTTHTLPVSWPRGNRDFWWATDACFPTPKLLKDIKNNKSRQLEAEQHGCLRQEES